MKKIMLLIVELAIAFSMTACVVYDKTAEVDTTYKVSDADAFISVPDLRQYGDYTCGTTCVQMIMNYLYPYDADINLSAYEEALKTDKSSGTSPENILKFFDQNNVSYTAQSGMTTESLEKLIDNGTVIMMCIQAWSSADDGSYNIDDPSMENYLTEGHWVICVGYKKGKEETVFYFNDPACVGRCVMNNADLDKRWVDMDGSGNMYDHYGIAINNKGAYHPDTTYYLK